MQEHLRRGYLRVYNISGLEVLCGNVQDLFRIESSTSDMRERSQDFAPRDTPLSHREQRCALLVHLRFTRS